LSKRSAQIIGRLCHGTPRINRADDTTAGQESGRYGVLAWCKAVQARWEAAGRTVERMIALGRGRSPGSNSLF
jgi:hypothetical protein